MLTGIADGRVAAGSSDAVNGHQLFEAVNAAGGSGDCSDGTGTDSQLCGDGASAAGDQATALGDTASANFGGSVALGFGSAATMDIAAAQAAYSGVTIGGLTLTEGTDAAGGEMNIGGRLVTGVADGRIASGSSDAINGHQLFEVASGLDGRITANTNNITALEGDVSQNTTDIANLQGELTIVQGDVTQNTTDIASLQGDVAVNQTAITNNTTAITTNTAAIGNNTGAITVNTASIGNNAVAIARMNTGVSDLTSRVEVNEDTNTEQDMRLDVQESQLAAQATSIGENALRTTENALAILANTNAVSENRGLIDRNYALGLTNQQSILDLEDGLAAIASLPDMYLSPRAKWSASGGLGFYEGSVGVGATLAIRGNDNWALGASFGSAGSKVTGKIQVRYEGF